MTLQEFSRQRDNITRRRYEDDIDSGETAKRKKQNDYVKWFMKQNE